MSATTARVGRGTVLAIKRTGAGSFTDVAENVRIASPELDNGQVEATHLTSDDNAREFLPSGFTDHGMVDYTANYYSDNVETMLDLCVDQETCDFQITIPDKKNASGTNTIITFRGFVSKFNPFGEAAVDANTPLRTTASIKITGKITFTKSTAGA